MLNLAIETGYNYTLNGKDKFGARLYLQQFFKKIGIKVVRVSINKFNKEKGMFDEYNILDDNGNNLLVNKSIKPDILWIRNLSYILYKHNILKKFIIVPSIKISIIGHDKMENFKFLEKYQPMTCLLKDFLENTEIQKKFTGKVVLKPIRANGGKGIKLFNKKDLIKKNNQYEGLGELFIVQEFKDFSKGFGNITKGVHDLRLMFAGKKIIEITLREPKKGDFRSNIGSGGKQIFLDKSQIPKDLLRLAKKIYIDIDIDDNNIFSMDFAYCKKENKWYLLEINSSPGTRFYQTDKNVLKKIFKGLAKFFINLTKK
ncbi:MAG: hypothetical protein WAZ12_02560 [Candidatus Absconditicoccaceae bacterium]